MWFLRLAFLRHNLLEKVVRRLALHLILAILVINI